MTAQRSTRGPSHRYFVLLAAILIMLLASACGISTNSDDLAGDAPVNNPDGFSLLTREGVDDIQETRRARFDLRERTITRKAVGLETGRLGPIVGGAGEPEVTLEPVAPERTEEVRTSTFSVTFTGNDERASTITWFEAYDTGVDGQEALERAVERWGLPDDQPAAWQEASETGQDELTLRAGVAPSGLVSSLTVRRTSGGGQTHQWMLLLRPGLYAPQSHSASRPPRGPVRTLRLRHLGLISRRTCDHPRRLLPTRRNGHREHRAHPRGTVRSEPTLDHP